jgi:hypothetical protein
MPTSTPTAAATKNKKKASTKVIIKNFPGSIDILFQDENFTVELLADDPADSPSLNLVSFGEITKTLRVLFTAGGDSATVNEIISRRGKRTTQLINQRPAEAPKLTIININET